MSLKSNISYGEFSAQKLDIYLPPGEPPFPVAMFIHGGGWVNGDKVEQLDVNRRDRLLWSGVAVVSINYRYMGAAKQAGVFPPVLLPLNDSKRALQFIRAHAREWGLDPERVALFGGSAGAFTALWLGLSDDMAQPNADDPILRQSTRVCAIGAYAAQTTLDPIQMRQWVGPELTYGAHAFGLNSFDRFFQRRDEFVQWYPQISPAAIIDAGDPPVYLSYDQGLNPESPDKSYYTHSPRFGIGFLGVSQEVGATCFLDYPGHPAPPGEGDLIDFLIHNLNR